MATEIQRWTLSDVEGGLEEDSFGALVKYSEHLDIVYDLEHDRAFWAWKYSCREDECAALAQQIRDLGPDGVLEG